MKLREKLILVFLLVIIVPLTALGVLSYSKAADIIKVETEGISDTLVEEIEGAIEKQFEVYTKSIDYLDENKIISSYDREDIDYDQKVSDTLGTYTDTYNDVIHAYMGYESKKFIVYPFVDVGNDFDPTSRPWYKDAVNKKGIIWTSPYVDDATKEMVISAASPIYTEEGVLLGVLGIDINISNLRESILDVKIGETGHLTIFDSENNFVVEQNEELVGTKLSNEEIISNLNKDNSKFKFQYEGNEKLGIYKSIKSLNWKLLATIDMGEINSKARPLSNLVIVVGAIGLLISLIIAYFFSKLLIRKIRRLTDVIETSKSGDLTSRFSYSGKDEINTLGNDFNDMLDSITGLLNNTKTVVDEMYKSSDVLDQNSDVASAAAEETSASIDEIASGASSQANDVENCLMIASRLDEEFETILDISSKMHEDSDETDRINKEGLSIVEELSVKNNLNTVGIEKINDAIKDLDKNSVNIQSILATIESISDQTSLLALNASIEAARAGEHGRGFGVVAEEIRKLAEESNLATQNIKVIIDGIKGMSSNAMVLMDEVNGRNKDQNQAVEKVMTVFDKIGSSIVETNTQIDAMNSEVSRIENIKLELLRNIENISSVSQQTAASIQQVNASVEEQTAAINEVSESSSKLAEISSKLDNEINKFKI
ncbi:MAG: methyl-accepting chemotaxis protein [Firmicutes bacterium]|nr:methyl-accepting chemotaxis protein [Bacillota bacterium]